MTPPVNLLYLGGALFFGGVVVATFAFVPGVVIAVGGVATMVAHYVKSRRDPYSLATLQEIEERAEADRLREATGRAEGDGVMCPRCFTVFDAHLPSCPNCAFRSR